VVKDGLITLPPEEVPRFAPQAVTPAGVQAQLVVPSRTVAALRAGDGSGDQLVLFEDADVAATYSEYVRGKANYARTSTQLTRLKDLLSRNAVAGKDVVDAQADFLEADASVREYETKLRQSGFDPKLLASLRRGDILAVADVPESRLGAVRVGQTASFVFAAFPAESIAGKVVSVGETVDPDTRTIRVAIRLLDGTQRLKPGMFAKVTIAEGVSQALTVPLGAVVSVDARNWVFVKQGAAGFERREVRLGPDDGHVAQVLSGLARGDSVATANAILLKGLAFGY
jgi:multidrug efflux pump subunit AcrA (membrane-fusion protein)